MQQNIEFERCIDFLPVLSIYFSLECQLLLEVKNILNLNYERRISIESMRFFFY